MCATPRGSILKYLLSIVRGTRLIWIPLSKDNLAALKARNQKIHPEFVLEVDNPWELETKGVDFISNLVNRNSLN